MRRSIGGNARQPLNPKERGAKARQPVPPKHLPLKERLPITTTEYTETTANCQSFNTLNDDDIGGQYEPCQYEDGAFFLAAAPDEPGRYHALASLTSLCSR